MTPNTQARVEAMLATIRERLAAKPDDYDGWNRAFDQAEALYVFAHDAGEYNLFSEVMRLPFQPKPDLAIGDGRGLTDEGMTIYRELLAMEGLT